MILSASAYTHQGNRKDNQDAFFCSPEQGLFIVCDGVGGAVGGKEAAEAAVAAASQHLLQVAPDLEKLALAEQAVEAQRAISHAVQQASQSVYSIAAERGGVQMGSTLIAVLCISNRAYIGHVGDSRLYMIRASSPYQLTSDHTMLNEMIARGDSIAEDIANSPYANVLTRWIGQAEHVPVDLMYIDLLPEDSFLIASDGLESIYSDGEALAAAFSAAPIEELASQLVEKAVALDGSDNTTCITMHLASPEVKDAQEESRFREISLSIETLQNLYIFAGLDLPEIMQVMEQAAVMNIEPERMLIEEGSRSNSLMVILEGTLRVTRKGTHLQDLTAGNHVGEIALLTDNPRSATVAAITPAKVLCIEKYAFWELLRRDSLLGIKLLHNINHELIERLLRTNDMLYESLN